MWSALLSAASRQGKNEEVHFPGLLWSSWAVKPSFLLCSRAQQTESKRYLFYHSQQHFSTSSFQAANQKNKHRLVKHLKHTIASACHCHPSSRAPKSTIWLLGEALEKLLLVKLSRSGSDEALQDSSAFLRPESSHLICKASGLRLSALSELFLTCLQFWFTLFCFIQLWQQVLQVTANAKLICFTSVYLCMLQPSISFTEIAVFLCRMRYLWLIE